MAEVPQERIYPLELREMELTGKPYRYLSGRAVPYNTWQDVGPFWEHHAEGSFARSTKGGSGKPGLPLVIGHDHDNLDNVVGHAETWTHDATGMFGVWRLNEQPRAQQAAALVRSGDLTGLSVGFQEVHFRSVPRPRQYELASTADKPWVMRTESRLLEVSLTTIPAYEGGVINVRSLGDPGRYGTPPTPTPELDEWRGRLESLKAGR